MAFIFQATFSTASTLVWSQPVVASTRWHPASSFFPACALVVHLCVNGVFVELRGVRRQTASSAQARRAARSVQRVGTE